MGMVRAFWPLVALTGLLWFLGGLMIPLSRALVALQVRPEQRGRMLGMFSMVTSLASLIGGATLGPMADALGYPGMMRWLSLVYVIPLSLLFFLRDADAIGQHAAGDRPDSAHRPPTPDAQRSASLPSLFYLLLLGSLVISAGMFVSNLARSLVMNQRAFSATAISSIAMAGGLAGLAINPTVGWLSDRVGFAKLLLCLIAAALVGRLITAAATDLWHYWLAMAFVSIAGARVPIISALACELAPRESLGSAMSLVATAGWMGGVVGYALGGNAVSALGSTGALLAAALSVLVAAPLVLVALGGQRPETK